MQAQFQEEICEPQLIHQVVFQLSGGPNFLQLHGTTERAREETPGFREGQEA